MRIRVAPPFLNEALALASTVASTRTVIPSLNCVKLTSSTAPRAALTVEATDLEIGIRYYVPLIELDQEGAVVLPAAKLAALMRQVRDPDVEISADNLVATIRTSDGRFRMVGLDPADFPGVPQFDPTSGIPVPAKDLAAMVRRTAFAVSTDTVRFALTGQLLDIRNSQLCMVASDGKRLSLVRKALPKAVKDVRIIVPPKTMNLLTRLLLPDEETVLLDVTENTVRMSTRRAQISSRVIDGTFPDYEAVIPRDNPYCVTVDRELLDSALRRAGLMSSDEVRATKFSLGSDLLTLYSRSQEVGEAKIDLKVEYQGEPREIVFNPDFLLDYLGVVDQERITLRLKDRSTAGLFSASDDYQYVLMPLDVEV